MVKETNSARETIKLGKNLGSNLKPGEILALSGQLGAGKTTLIQGIAEGLGVKDYVTSPTFILINEYQGRLPFYHIDLYRLEDPEQIEELGISEYFEKDGIVVIEWAERMGEQLPESAKQIKIEVVDENKRKIWLSWE
ncbi:tRNA (adenosine(37)-N6)-threonylcarbamoyltransferase complex ATPase subunit type 1 TsaE [Candidatus Saganbacteria bacterium]|nr:tRNA (adenosine(37)-N6)-threonylcarbamoyltransferase complex ATPase subunit type 1 TsaE [Candidatus Saganbacteria bacterium]